MTLFISFGLILLCCLIIWRASDGFEAASEYLGRNLTDGVRGATINAIGSSMPELFTTLWFLFVLHDRDGFAGGIGTTAGSAVFNAMVIPAVVIMAVLLAGLAKKVTVSKKVILRDGISLLLAEIVLIFLVSGDTLSWWHGVVLMAMYGVYVVVLFTGMSADGGDAGDDDDDDADNDEAEGSLIKAVLTLDLERVFIRGNINGSSAWSMLIVAMLVIGGSCALLVYACESAAGELGIATYFVAVILASAATSVPDTILSYRDAMDGEYDDAVANALGSNIFDVCFALGLPLFLYTMIYGDITMSAGTVENITELRILLLISTAAAFVIFLFGKGMARLHAALLLTIYLLFTLFILAKAYGAAWAIELGQSFQNLINF